MGERPSGCGRSFGRTFRDLYLVRTTAGQRHRRESGGGASHHLLTHEVFTTSCGGVADVSLLVRASAVVERPVRAIEKTPFPVMSGVTSTVVQVDTVTGPEEPVTVAAVGGAFAYVIVDSPQVVSATPRTS